MQRLSKQQPTILKVTFLFDFLVRCRNLAPLCLAFQLAIKDEFLPFDLLIHAFLEFCFVDLFEFGPGGLEFWRLQSFVFSIVDIVANKLHWRLWHSPCWVRFGTRRRYCFLWHATLRFASIVSRESVWPPQHANPRLLRPTESAPRATGIFILFWACCAWWTAILCPSKWNFVISLLSAKQRLILSALYCSSIFFSARPTTAYRTAGRDAACTTDGCIYWWTGFSCRCSPQEVIAATPYIS